jgi:hypothetical protein
MKAKGLLHEFKHGLWIRQKRQQEDCAQHEHTEKSQKQQPPVYLFHQVSHQAQGSFTPSCQHAFSFRFNIFLFCTFCPTLSRLSRQNRQKPRADQRSGAYNLAKGNFFELFKK